MLVDSSTRILSSGIFEETDSSRRRVSLHGQVLTAGGGRSMFKIEREIHLQIAGSFRQTARRRQHQRHGKDAIRL